MRSKSPLAFASWEPDKAQISGSAATAKGVISLSGRYAPDRSFLPLKIGAFIGGTALGGAGFYEAGTNARTFVGDEGHIFEIVARTPQDVSKIGGYTASPAWGWSFEQFGQTVLATARGLSQVQYFTFGSSTVFADLTTGPGQSDGLFRIREFMFSGKDFLVKNSVFNNFTDWNPASPTGVQAGEFSLPADGGLFVSGVGGQFGIVFQERKVHRLTYTGGTAPFERDEIEDKRGALGPNALCRYGEMTFFASEDGFRVTDGNTSTALGENKIDRYFSSRLNYAQRAKVALAFDVEKKLLRCIYPAGSSTRPNEMLVYSVGDGRWSYDDCELDLIFESPRPGINVNDDEAIAAVAGSSIIDEVNIPVDSPVWRESRKQVMGVDLTGQVGTFEGANRAATLETGYGEVMPGRMGFVSEVWPLVDAATCTAVITTKTHRLSDTPASTPVTPQNEFGCVPVMADARWIKTQVQIPFDTAWTEASGIDWDAEPSGEF